MSLDEELTGPPWPAAVAARRPRVPAFRRWALRRQPALAGRHL